MSRPRKHRKVCHFPNSLSFFPSETAGQKEPIVLTVDEYETLRLIDREGFSQEACGDQMGVARTTVQLIYASARKKLAEMLVDGKPLQIAGGDFRLCDGTKDCSQKYCYKQRYHQQYEKPKGDSIMRIAVTYENGQIFQHFGHTQEFKIYDVQDGRILASEVVNTNGSGHGALAGVLTALHADVLICGGIGGGAINALSGAGIEVIGGAEGDVRAVVEALLNGTLQVRSDFHCNHHHHDEGHSCGSHSCGSGENHSCGNHSCNH